MNETIWKFEITPPVMGNTCKVDLPRGAKVVSVNCIGDQMFIWVKFYVDMKDQDFVPHYFEIFGTGHEIHNDMGVDRKYIGTCLMHGGGLVWHVFERMD